MQPPIIDRRSLDSLVFSVTNHSLTEPQDSGRDGLELTLMTKLCGGGSCPTVYRTSRGTLVVQGYTVAGDTVGVDLPTGEQMVEVPMELLVEALKAGTQVH